MASVINTNTLSMVTQQNLNQSQNALSASMERLSTGLRINSAKDDSAGQAIANRMDAQITGLSQAQRNANDGISLAQTTEGALNQVNDNLLRVRELTVQAQNGTNSESDLSSIQDEITARMEEINRISEQTNFNGTNVLDGSKTEISIQVGANDGESISIKLQSMGATDLGMDGFNVKSSPSGTLTDVQAGDDGSGNLVTVADSTVVDTEGNDVASTYTLKQDDNGDYYATDGTENYAVSDVEIDDTTDPANPTVDYVVDVANGPIAETTPDPLQTIDDALAMVDNMRSDLGAVQNRFDSAITNLATTETNLASAQSRIQDADYAEEVSSMTTAQILQQAGTSMLTQANQVPQNVLSLLG
ncbi:FliC/FljB family flagellin [Cobetia sp. UCD-24C]|uniref:FliC/FljB family flagellin n=1 Tax=Cobetia sp. UCD-24C TaxID=1716176 RepID=UPI0006CA2660|nr:FliC/FljB family flagellin [Cobetia sp. UCD-24C]KPM77131.1 flagellin [Cobetia sp. UCD-24C]